jgi:hypothetical protein
MVVPKTLGDVDATFMTALLLARGVIDPDNRVVSTEESGVGMTAGYFSAVKRVRCRYARSTDAVDAFVVKTWPAVENAPKDEIARMFVKDIGAYSMPVSGFFPRAKVYLADFHAPGDRWALVMDDAAAFGQQKLHEEEMTFDEVMHMIPKLVEIAVAWEGCHEGSKAATLAALGANLWTSEENLVDLRMVMPRGAPLFDIMLSTPGSPLVDGMPWDREIGRSFCTLITRKVEALYRVVAPGQGATCTVVHGDLRGDNLFFCPPTPNYPDGWLAIDYQQLYRGPVPSDLAYLMTSGSVLPHVYAAGNREKIMRAFYDGFIGRTNLYRNYTWDDFRREFAVMATVQMVNFIRHGAGLFAAGVNDALGARVELGTRRERESDLPREEQRQRMFWRKAITNFRTTFKDLGLYAQLESLPDNVGTMAPWYEVPDRLNR